MVCKSLIVSLLFLITVTNYFSCLGMATGGRGKLYFSGMQALLAAKRSEPREENVVEVPDLLEVVDDTVNVRQEGTDDYLESLISTEKEEAAAAAADDDKSEREASGKVSAKLGVHGLPLLPSPDAVENDHGVKCKSLESYITWLLQNHATIGFTGAMSGRKIAAQWYGSEQANTKHGVVNRELAQISAALGMPLPKPHNAHLSSAAKDELRAYLGDYLNDLITKEEPLRVRCHEHAKVWQASTGETAGRTTIKLVVLEKAKEMGIKLISPRPVGSGTKRKKKILE